MLALFPKVPKIQRLKALKIDVFDYPIHTLDFKVSLVVQLISGAELPCLANKN